MQKPVLEQELFHYYEEVGGGIGQLELQIAGAANARYVVYSSVSRLSLAFATSFVFSELSNHLSNGMPNADSLSNRIF